MTSPMSMQYQAQILDHNTPGSCFHSLSRKVCRCHIWKHLGADNQGRRSDGNWADLPLVVWDTHLPVNKEDNRENIDVFPLLDQKTSISTVIIQ